MQFHRPVLVCLMAMTLAGCGMEGVRHVVLVDQNKNPLNEVIVFPLYNGSFGMGIGPEGKGFWFPFGASTKPFSFNSGEDLMSKQRQGRGIIIPIPPFIFIGTSQGVNRWLFIKKGYSPLAVTRIMVYGPSPLVMETSNNDDNRKAIDLLLSQEPNQAKLKSMFKANGVKGNIHVEIDSPSRATLITNR